MRITVDVSDAQGRLLEEAARRLNVAPEILAAAAVQDLLTRSDADFARIADRLIEKNRDLYRHLA